MLRQLERQLTVQAGRVPAARVHGDHANTEYVLGVQGVSGVPTLFSASSAGHLEHGPVFPVFCRLAGIASLFVPLRFAYGRQRRG